MIILTDGHMVSTEVSWLPAACPPHHEVPVQRLSASSPQHPATYLSAICHPHCQAALRDQPWTALSGTQMPTAFLHPHPNSCLCVPQHTLSTRLPTALGTQCQTCFCLPAPLSPSQNSSRTLCPSKCHPSLRLQASCTFSAKSLTLTMQITGQTETETERVS